MTWSRTWLDRLPHLAGNDLQMAAGRTLARRRRPEIELEPGSITARFVQRGSVSVATVAFRALSDEAWASLVARISARPALAASVLTGDLPFELHQPADDGPGLLPGASDLVSSCSCESWDEPCAHVWAVLSVLGELFDRDPNVILLLRSRSREQLIEPIRVARGMASSAGAVSHQPRGADPGQDVVLHPPPPAALPPPLPAPWRPATPTALPVPPPLDSGLLLSDLVALVADGAARALSLLDGEGSGGLHQSVEVDLVRRAASAPDQLERLARVAHVDPEELERRAMAWRWGGPAALAVLDDRWDPPASVLAVARALVPGGRVAANTVTAGRFQLRVDRHHRWWRLDADGRLGWLVSAGPFDDPAEVLD